MYLLFLLSFFLGKDPLSTSSYKTKHSFSSVQNKNKNLTKETSFNFNFFHSFLFSKIHCIINYIISFHVRMKKKIKMQSTKRENVHQKLQQNQENFLFPYFLCNFHCFAFAFRFLNIILKQTDFFSVDL